MMIIAANDLEVRCSLAESRVEVGANATGGASSTLRKHFLWPNSEWLDAARRGGWRATTVPRDRSRSATVAECGHAHAHKDSHGEFKPCRPWHMVDSATKIALLVPSQ